MAEKNGPLNLNLAVLKKSRHEPKPGDVFVMRPADGQFLYGRVIDDDAKPIVAGGFLVIYVYRTRSEQKLEVPDLRVDDLLTPPIIVNRQPWLKGYFEHVAHEPLSPADRLPQHCFRDFRGLFFDESRNELEGPTEPVGEFALQSLVTLDRIISRALAGT